MTEAVAAGTRKNCLRSAFQFTDWCLKNGLATGTRLPVPDVRTLVHYSVWRAGQGNSPGYIRSRLSGIGQCFEWHHFPNVLCNDAGAFHPDLSRVLKGISHLLSQKTETLPMHAPLMHAMLDVLPTALPELSLHDRCVVEFALMNGMHSLLRASEQASPTTTTADVHKTARGWDLTFADHSYTFTINAAKNDALRTGSESEVHEAAPRQPLVPFGGGTSFLEPSAKTRHTSQRPAPRV